MSKKIPLDFSIELDIVIDGFVSDMFPDKIVDVGTVLLDDGQLLTGKKIDITLTLENMEK